MDLKPQELLVLLKVSAHPTRKFTFAALAEELAMSAAEVHASVKRAKGAGLVNERGRGDWAPIRPALQEFLVHGVRYAFPAEMGPVKRGIPTAHAAPVLAGRLLSAGEHMHVWEDAHGSVLGQRVEPLHKGVPHAVRRDATLYAMLALVDAVRLGQERESAVAGKLLAEYLREPT